MNYFQLGQPLIHLKTVDSTNKYAMHRVQNKNAEHGTVILADYQTEGKGQGRNKWTSEKDANLLFSIIVKLDFLSATKQFYLSMAVANGLSVFLRRHIQNVLIKWPNDIFIVNKKVSGILIENTIMGNYLNYSVIGVGINVNQKDFPEELPDATSLYLATGSLYNRNELLSGILETLADQMELLVQQDFLKIRTTYLNHLYLHYEWHEFHDDSGIFKGKIVDVEESGALVIMTETGNSRKFGFREVRF